MGRRRIANTRRARRLLLATVGVVTVGLITSLWPHPVRAQVCWVGPLQEQAVAVAPSGGSIWLLSGGPMAGGGYSIESLSIVDQNSRGGWGKIEQFTYQGLTPDDGVGAYAISSSGDGVPYVAWPRYFAPFDSYYNEVSYIDPSNGVFGQVDPMGAQGYLPGAMSVAAGDLTHNQSDLWGVDPGGNTWVFAGQFFETASQLPAGAVKLALFNETVWCGGGAMHQPFAMASDHTIWRYQFSESVGACIPAPDNGCEAGCWQQVPGLASDITANDLILGYPAQGSPLWQWSEAEQNWVPFIDSPNGATLQGIGASAGYASASPNAAVVAFDTTGQIYQYCSQLYGQCGGEGYTGPTCCAFTQDSTSPPSSPTGSACVYVNPYYSQCQPQ